MLYSLFTLIFFVVQSLSFSLAGPDTAQSGVSIEFTWTLDDGEPLSFGLMQRSLAGDAPILGIDGVTNSADHRIILSGVDQLSYNPAIQPDQFSPGKQLTVTENTSPASTSHCIKYEYHRANIQDWPFYASHLSMTTPPTAIATAADSVSTLSSDGNPGSSIFPSTTFAAGLVNSKSKQSTMIPAYQVSLTLRYPESRHSYRLLTTPPAQPPLPTTAPSSQHATKSGPNIHTIIAAAVILVIVLIVGGLALFLRQQRSSTASRLRRFSRWDEHRFQNEYTVTYTWGPTRDISAGNMVVWDKQPFAGNNGDVTMQEGNGTGAAVNGRIPVTPPPSYDGHSFVKFD
ncbi:hypothetical protein B0H13DRAFT_1916163 [Mycena leptocephala]|nr:hypothetical protein B0H13DRAFT_1916163 [Mycena leptocephala]